MMSRSLYPWEICLRRACRDVTVVSFLRAIGFDLLPSGAGHFISDGRSHVGLHKGPVRVIHISQLELVAREVEYLFQLSQSERIGVRLKTPDLLVEPVSMLPRYFV